MAKAAGPAFFNLDPPLTMDTKGHAGRWRDISRLGVELLKAGDEDRFVECAAAVYATYLQIFLGAELCGLNNPELEARVTRRATEMINEASGHLTKEKI